MLRFSEINTRREMERMNAIISMFMILPSRTPWRYVNYSTREKNPRKKDFMRLVWEPAKPIPIRKWRRKFRDKLKKSRGNRMREKSRLANFATEIRINFRRLMKKNRLIWDGLRNIASWKKMSNLRWCGISRIRMVTAPRFGQTGGDS